MENTNVANKVHETKVTWLNVEDQNVQFNLKTN